MTARYSYFATALSLFVLLLGLLTPRPSAFTLAVSVPVAALLLATLRPPTRWGGWVAVWMVPYFCVAIGELVANPESRLKSTVVAVSAVCAFFAAFDYMRRTGTSFKH